MQLKRLTVESIFDFLLVFFIIARITFRVTVEWAFLATAARLLFYVVAAIKTFLSGKIPSSHFFLWAGAFLLLSFFVSVVSDYSTNSFDMLSVVVRGIVDVFVVVLYCHEEQKVELIFRALYITGVVIFLFQLSRYDPEAVSSTGMEGNLTALRVSVADAEHVNVTGYNLLISLFGAIHVMKFQKYNKVFMCIALFSIYGGIILSGSRKILLAALAVAVIMLVKGRKNILMIVAAAIVCLVAYYLVMNVEPLYKIIGWRLDTSLTEDASFTGRMDLMKTAFNTGLESIIGVGLNNSKYYTLQNLYAHCNPLEIFADLGFLGFVSYYSLHTAYITNVFFKLKGENKKFWLVVIIAILVVDIGQVSYNLYSSLLMLACIPIGLQKKFFGFSKPIKGLQVARIS